MTEIESRRLSYVSDQEGMYIILVRRQEYRWLVIRCTAPTVTPNHSQIQRSYLAHVYQVHISEIHVEVSHQYSKCKPHFIFSVNTVS